MRFKTILRAFLVVLLIVVAVAVFYGWRAFPIATGFGAKAMCSAIYVSGRNESDIKAVDLNFFPLKYATLEVNSQDSSVTCSLFGLAKKKAIFRSGVGATLVNDTSEANLRKQIFNIPGKPSLLTDTISWPSGDKITDSFPASVDSLSLAAAIDVIFRNPDTPQTNHTRALIVLYNGRIIAERYAPGFTKQTKLPGWSMAKSVTSALTGLVVEQGKLNISEPASVPEWSESSDPRHAIKLVDILQQSSGLDFSEQYNVPADANRMLFMESNAAAFTASHKADRKPGTHFRYSSGNTNLISRILRDKLGDDAYYALPYTGLFYKIGMYNTILEPDASGNFVGSSFCFATARDWARFGLLYLNNGNWNGEQVLNADWIKQSIAPAPAAEMGEYGFQWWLNAGQKNHPENRTFPELPADMYWADGFEGQNVFVIPSKKLVVVRLGLTRTKFWGEHEFLKSLIRSVDKVAL